MYRLHQVSIVVLVVAMCGNAVAQQASKANETLIEILRDRPEMTDVISAEHIIYEWVAQRFKGDSKVGRVAWDPREPHSGRPSECLPAVPRKQTPPIVRITKHKGVSGIDKWFLLVFELNNIPDCAFVARLSIAARNGSIKRTAFINACVRHEFDALKVTSDFFRKNAIPNANEANSPRYTQFVARKFGSMEFGDYLRYLDARRDQYDPRDYFGNVYDRLRSQAAR